MKSDGVAFAATGLTSDAESRDLLEDALRGMLAMWRLAMQEKSPELVSVIRRFQIDNDSDGVSIRGMLPSGFLESLAAKRQAARSAPIAPKPRNLPSVSTFDPRGSNCVLRGDDGGET